MTNLNHSRLTLTHYSTREGRDKSSSVSAEEYRLACYRYIEMTSIAAGMVMVSEQYRWHAWGRKNVLLSDHPLYQGFGESIEVSQHVYHEIFKYHITDKEIHEIKGCLGYLPIWQ